MIVCPACRTPPYRKDGSCHCERLYVPDSGPCLFRPQGGDPLDADFLISVQEGDVIVIRARHDDSPLVHFRPEDAEELVFEAVLLAGAVGILES